MTKGPRLPGLKRPLLCIVLILILGLAVTLLGSDLRGEAGKGQLTGEELRIDAAGGPVILFVEVVNTNETRATGLMFREELAPKAGMLFDFKREQPVAFWMKDTLIPLDIFFIKADGRIVNIAKRAVPHSERSIASDEPVLGVLETNAGVADRLGIKVGDTVRHPVFGNAP